MSTGATAVSAILSPPSVRTVPQAIARMEAIAAALPPDDGVALFNRLYLEMTKAVARSLDAGEFNDFRFMQRLDVVFANLFFRALAWSAATPARVPRAWVPLFESRSAAGIAPIQFALAGMNAHINRDLPVALVNTCRRLGAALDSKRFADYLRINAVMESVQEEVKRWLATGLVGIADAALGRIDDVVSIWSLSRARSAAWVNGQTLRHLGIIPPLAAEYLGTLDRTVGFAGRGLLVRTL